MPASSTIPLTHPRGWLLTCAIAAFAFLAATLVPAQTTTAQDVPEVDIQAATDGITVEFFATTPRNVLTLSVRVVGPGRFVFEQRVEDTTLQWIPPENLADGFYHWEAWVVSADIGAPLREWTPVLEARAADHWFDEEFKQTHLATGSFKVENGLLETVDQLQSEEEGVSRARRVAGAILDFLVPSARAFEEGSSNNFFGTDAGANDDGNNNNSFFGGEAGRDNTTGSQNSFFGRAAGRLNTTGNNNSFFGRTAGISNTTGFSNSFFGSNAGLSNTEGTSNSFFGFQSGFNNTVGTNNSFFGIFAGFSNTTASGNSFFGDAAGLNNTTASNNSFFGDDAGRLNTTGFNNSFFGGSAGFSNTTGFLNSFFGVSAGFNNTTGTSNSFFGRGAGGLNTTGFNNSFFGLDAGFNNTTGGNNVFFGSQVGVSNTTEDNNSFIGTFTDGAAGITNATALGHRTRVNQSNSLVLGSINGFNGATANVNVGIGISAPAAPLHVRRFDNTAQARVTETGASAVQQLFRLEKNGFPAFNFTDTSQSDVSWTFRLAGNEPNDRFEITKVGSGGSEFRVFANGDAELPNGVLIEASSRHIKDNIVELSADEVLEKLAALAVHEWSYAKNLSSRHIGPMAEDFHAAFGLGRDDKGIAPKDLAGVALAAAKGLAERSARLEAENAELRNQLESENAELRDRLAQLEAMLIANK